MKKLLLTSATAACLALATPAFAGNSTSDVTQAAGTVGNAAAVTQTGSVIGSESFINQTNSNNMANVIQSDDGLATIGFAVSSSTINQGGDGGNATVIQQQISSTPAYGYAATNSSLIDQIGDGNGANVTQYGDAQDSTITQLSDGNQADVIQGDLLATPAYEAGQHLSTITQDVGNNTTYVQMASFSSTVTIDQQGVNNIAEATSNLLSRDHASAITQIGDFNMAFNNAQGNGIMGPSDNYNASTVLQTGDSNLANVNQAGNGDSSTITQNNDNGSATIDQQTGGGDNDSTLTQDGLMEHAEVTQSGIGNMSMLVQSGGGNMAFVTQSTDDNTSNVTQLGSGTVTVNQ